MRLFRPSKGCLGKSTMATASAPVRSIGIRVWSTIINDPHAACLRGFWGTPSVNVFIAGGILQPLMSRSSAAMAFGFAVNDDYGSAEARIY